jgi:carboxyl-terminal processing protease
MRRLWVLALPAVAAGIAAAQAAHVALPTQGLTPAERSANLESFEKVWTTVRDKHWDPNLNGVDWQKVHDELKPKMEAAKNMDAAREVLNDMLGRLHQTHFGIFPGEVYHDLESKDGVDAADAEEKNTDEAHPGIVLRVLEGRAVVTEIEPGSPAAAKNVTPGWVITRVGKTDIAPVIERVSKQFKDSTLLGLRLTRAVGGRLQGRTGSTVHVEFLDGADKKVGLDLERAKPRGKVVQMGNLPSQFVWSEWRKPRPDVGYVRFNMFMDPEGLADTMASATAGCKRCKGFIVDVRGNPGGIGGLAMGVAGWFIDEKGVQLGTTFMRGLKLNFVIFPRPETFHGPVAVLVDGDSASTSEIFAGGLKDVKRARIFGTRTAGAALPSLIERLPNGDGFQYAVANYISQGGKPLEGIGAIPDEEVRLTRKQLIEGKDAVLDAAVAWIEKQ